MYTIRKEFAFSAAHHLLGLPPEHPCSRVHGHNYVITIELISANLNVYGFVTDYRELYPIKDFIDKSLDHQDLNEVLEINPTAENIAKLLFTTFKKRFPQLHAIEVSETPKTSARYTPDHD